MLCLIHGYGLSGSGSNLWTRAIARALCQNGATIHLVCQEKKPEAYLWIAEAYAYDEAAEPTQLFAREVPYAGRCILHRPKIDLLPVYVQPSARVTGMACILDMDDEAVAHYVARNEQTLHRIVDTHGITAMHVNHVVLMAVAAHRVSQQTGVPFAVLPHGSAIEYIVKHDPHMHRLAEQVLAGAARIFNLNREMRGRVLEVFPDVEAPEARMVTVPVGVDVEQFDLIPPRERPQAIERLKASIAEKERGKRPEQTKQLQQRLADDLTLEATQALFSETSDYAERRPDAELEARLDAVDWTNERILVYVGRLLGAKGVPSLVAALPPILAETPNTRLILAGAGPLREELEALVWALGHDQQRLAQNLARWGSALEGEAAQPYEAVQRFFEKRRADGTLDVYFAQAEQHLPPDRVLFTGYLEHDALCLLYAVADAGIFPSVVAEASPMVVPEAMASGCFPIGTDHAGMAAALDVAAEALPADVAAHTRLRPHPDLTVADIIAQVPAVLAQGGAYREAFRKVAVQKFEWRRIAANMAEAMREMAAG